MGVLRPVWAYPKQNLWDLRVIVLVCLDFGDVDERALSSYHYLKWVYLDIRKVAEITSLE